MKKTLLFLSLFMDISLAPAMKITSAEHIKNQLIQFRAEGTSDEEIAHLATDALLRTLDWPIICVNAEQYADLYKTLVEAGGNKNVQHPENGITALMFATLDNRPDIVEILLDLGVDHTIADNDGNTVKHHLNFPNSLLKEANKLKISDLLKEVELAQNIQKSKIS